MRNYKVPSVRQERANDTDEPDYVQKGGVVVRLWYGGVLF